MRRRWVGAFGALVCVLACAACTSDGSGEPEPEPIPTFVPPPLEGLAELGAGEGALTMLVRAGYAEPAWVAPFEATTGCRVTATAFSSERELRNGVAAGGFDVVSASGAVSLGLVGSGDVAPLNLDLLPASTQVVEDLKNRRWNTWNGITYGVPQGRSTQLLVWRTDSVPVPPRTLADVFDPEQPYAEDVARRDSPMTLAAAAVAGGAQDSFALDDDQLAAAFDLVAGSPAALSWSTDQELYDALAAGSVAVAIAPQPVVDRLVAAGVPVSSAVPTDEVLGLSDSWMVLADATHPNCAYRWLDYTLRGSVQAQVAAATGIAPASSEACVVVPDVCTNTGAQDTAFWGTVTVEVTPLADCLDGRDDIACTDEQDWQTAWREATGASSSPTGSSPSASPTVTSPSPSS